ncbi:MAG TPA: hypothetical protein VN207_06115 [Ktedonobacteraceae bacterium]|nr:hypothetical protein [Ktedonobacteraceae bacterium]
MLTDTVHIDLPAVVAGSLSLCSSVWEGDQECSFWVVGSSDHLIGAYRDIGFIRLSDERLPPPIGTTGFPGNGGLDKVMERFSVKSTGTNPNHLSLTNKKAISNQLVKQGYRTSHQSV